MKKLTLIIAVAGIIGLSSCAKTCNTCTLNGISTPDPGGSFEYCSDTFTNAEIDDAESDCIYSGGEWK